MEKVNEALNKWHKQEDEYDYIQKRFKIINEEKYFLEKKMKEYAENRYKYSDIAIKEHKYWANNNESVIIKIGEESGEFFLSKKGEKDRRLFSSSIGILLSADNPITEERYNEIYHKM